MDLNIIKYATASVPLADKNGLDAQDRKISGSDQYQRSLPEKQPSKFNINIANRSQASNFNYDDLLKPQTQQSYSWPPHYTIGEYIQKFPPTPTGVSYRHIEPSRGSYSPSDTIQDYTNLLNRSGLYPEKLSYPASPQQVAIDSYKGPRNKSELYHTDSRETANWLWNRRGLQLTDDQWNRAVKARQGANSQLNKMPQSLYFAWSRDNDDVNAYSMRLSNDKEFNQFMHVFNPKYFDRTYSHNDYLGYSSKQKDGQPLEPWERLMRFQDAQDHELSHSFNSVWKPGDLIGDYNPFFRISNDPRNPYYDDDTTHQRINKYYNIFRNTYLEKPQEYIGAMGRVKRYGAELGFDTTSPDPTKARAAMVQTLHHFANHKNPQELTPEQQRIHSWLNTAAGDHMEDSQYYQNKVNEILDKQFIISEEELKQKLRQNNINKDNYIKDVKSQFYKDVLDFMTDDTIQGLVQYPNLRALKRLV